MPEINTTSEILLARLAEGLDSTAKMTQALLSDLRESEADFAAMKTELNFLHENVRGLSDLIRDGGTSSLLTRVALIEQNIDNIKKWMDNHVDVHQRSKREINDIKKKISEIEYRLSAIETTLREIDEEHEEQNRVSRVAIEREQDFAHEKKKIDEKVKAEKHSAFIKVIAAICIGIIGLMGGYLAKACTEAAGKANPDAGIQTIITPVPLSSVAPPQNP